MRRLGKVMRFSYKRLKYPKKILLRIMLREKLKNKMNAEFSLPLPYPKVCGGFDERDCIGLYDLYAGRFSEMTAVCGYVYQSAVARDECLVRVLRGIAAVEMHHLDLLAGAIVSLGGDPVFAGRHNFFSGRYADAEREVCAFLQNDIYAEKNAAAEYRRVAELTRDGGLKELLYRIALDEDLHFDILSCEYERFSRSES